MSQELEEWIARAIELMLRCNSFEYDGALYSQAPGTSIGAPFAYGYSGWAIGRLEEEGLRRWAGKGRAGAAARAVKGREWREDERAKVDWWSRFWDDCLALWRGTQAEVPSFVAAMNSVDQDIKYTSGINWDDNSVVFLDLTITFDDHGFLQTNLYRKLNANNSLLLPSSCHRPTFTRSLVYSLVLRIRRICSTEAAAEEPFKPAG